MLGDRRTAPASWERAVPRWATARGLPSWLERSSHRAGREVRSGAGVVRLIVETANTLPLDPSVIAHMTVVQSSGASYFEPERLDTPHWATGFMVDVPARPFLSSASFGHDGAGGQWAFSDSEAKVGFGLSLCESGGWRNGNVIRSSQRGRLEVKLI